MIRRLAVDLTQGLGAGFRLLANFLDRQPWLWAVAAPLIVLEIWLVSR